MSYLFSNFFYLTISYFCVYATPNFSFDLLPESFISFPPSNFPVIFSLCLFPRFFYKSSMPNLSLKTFNHLSSSLIHSSIMCIYTFIFRYFFYTIISTISFSSIHSREVSNLVPISIALSLSKLYSFFGLRGTTLPNTFMIRFRSSQSVDNFCPCVLLAPLILSCLIL